MRRGCSSGRNPCRDGDLKYVWRQDGDELDEYVLDFSEDPGGEEESDRDVARPGSRVEETTRRLGEPNVGCVLTHQESPRGMQIWCVKTHPTRADSNPDTGPFPPNRSCTHSFSRIDGNSTTDSHLSGGPDVFPWIPVNVVHAAFQVLFISALVLPETALPDSTFVSLLARRAYAPFDATRFEVCSRELRLDMAQSGWIVTVVQRQRHYHVKMIWNQDHGDNRERSL